MRFSRVSVRVARPLGHPAPAGMVAGVSDLSDALRSLSTADDAWRFVRDFAAAWVAVAGRTPGALDDFRRAHPGDWVS